MSDILSEKLKWVKNHLDKDNPQQFPFKYNDLICEYFDKRANYYLSQQKASLGIIYIEKHAVQSFRGFEKQRTINELQELACMPLTSSSKIKISLLVGYLKWIEGLDTVNENIGMVAKEPDVTNDFPEIDPLSFINSSIMRFFIEAEKKALVATGKFSSDLRCAAFCELLYGNKYIIQTKTNRKTMNDFAKSRYGIDIYRALASGKKKLRNAHKNNVVDMQEPLRNCF